MALKYFSHFFDLNLQIRSYFSFTIGFFFNVPYLKPNTLILGNIYASLDIVEADPRHVCALTFMLQGSWLKVWPCGQYF